MHDKIVAGAVRWFGAVSLSLVCGGFAACAGTDTPPVDDALEDAIAQNFTSGGVAAAGASGNAGSGNAGSGNAGSSNAPAAGSGGSGDDDGAGGSDQEPDDEDPPPDDDDDPPPASGGGCDGFAILEERCNGPSCHGAGGLGNFAESEEAALAFVGVNGTVTCSADGPLLDPANPRASVILQKVNGTASCGADMPIGGAPLSDTEIDCLEEWIGSL